MSSNNKEPKVVDPAMQESAADASEKAEQLLTVPDKQQAITISANLNTGSCGAVE